MSTFDDLRKILNSKAVSAANQAAIDILLPNEEFRPPVDAVYTEFWHKTGGTKQIELGRAGAWELTVGIYQFNIYAPEKKGDGPATKAADVFRDFFNRKEWQIPPDNYIKITKSNIVTPFSGAKDGKYLVICDGEFHYYHMKRDAPSDFQ